MEIWVDQAMVRGIVLRSFTEVTKAGRIGRLVCTSHTTINVCLFATRLFGSFQIRLLQNVMLMSTDE
jgi:hypothetical protein